MKSKWMQSYRLRTNIQMVKHIAEISWLLNKRKLIACTAKIPF